jgi:hypothetical protein
LVPPHREGELLQAEGQGPEVKLVFSQWPQEEGALLTLSGRVRASILETEKGKGLALFVKGRVLTPETQRGKGRQCAVQVWLSELVHPRL